MRCIAYARDGEHLMTVYSEGKPGSLTFPLAEPFRETFEQECTYYLRGEVTEA